MIWFDWLSILLLGNRQDVFLFYSVVHSASNLDNYIVPESVKKHVQIWYYQVDFYRLLLVRSNGGDRSWWGSKDFLAGSIHLLVLRPNSVGNHMIWVLHVSNDLSDQCRKKVILNVPALDNAGTQNLKEFFWGWSRNPGRWSNIFLDTNDLKHGVSEQTNR